MIKDILNDKKRLYNLIVVLLVCIGVFLRVYNYELIKDGMHQDEAYALYESWSLLNFGIDSWENKYPIYLTVWGSGQSIMLAVLAMPFVALLGLNPIAIRLPILIMFIISILYFYKLCKLLIGEKFAFIALLIIITNPWHVMMSRWGLDCSLLFPFLVIALYYLLKGAKENPKYYLLSGLFFGLSLYTYVLSWIATPLILLITLIFFIKNKVNLKDKYLWFGIVIMVILAIPLLLFLLVNYDIIEPINSFITIPKLIQMRNSEFSLNNLITNFSSFFKIFYTSLSPNLTPGYGSLNIIGSLLFFIGFGYSFFDKNNKNIKWFSICFIVLFLYILTIFDLREHKMPFIYFFIIFLESYGLYVLIGKHNIIFKILLVLYLLVSVSFSSYLFNTYYYAAQAPGIFNVGFKDTILEASNKCDNVIIPESPGTPYSFLYSLLYDAIEIKPYEIKDNVVFKEKRDFSSLSSVNYSGKKYIFNEPYNYKEDKNTCYIKVNNIPLEGDYPEFLNKLKEDKINYFYSIYY